MDQLSLQRRFVAAHDACEDRQQRHAPPVEYEIDREVEPAVGPVLNDGPPGVLRRHVDDASPERRFRLDAPAFGAQLRQVAVQEDEGARIAERR